MYTFLYNTMFFFVFLRSEKKQKFSTQYFNTRNIIEKRVSIIKGNSIDSCLIIVKSGNIIEKRGILEVNKNLRLGVKPRYKNSRLTALMFFVIKCYPSWNLFFSPSLIQSYRFLFLQGRFN